MRQDRQPCVYILASGRNGTIYTGVSASIGERLHQHRTGVGTGFASRYGANRLVHIELYEDMPTAIAREKQIKRWRREWKLNPIERENPTGVDLAVGFGLIESAGLVADVDAETSSA